MGKRRLYGITVLSNGLIFGSALAMVFLECINLYFGQYFMGFYHGFMWSIL